MCRAFRRENSVSILCVLTLAMSGCWGGNSTGNLANQWPQKKDQDSINAIRSEKTEAAAALEVVFVHGLNGDAYSTWHPEGQPGNYFPKWIAEDFPDARVWSINYQASSSDWLGGSMPIEDRARQLSTVCQNKGIGINGKPVVFVSHSLGGLVVKEVLRFCATSSKDEERQFARSVRGVVFLATPHAGSDSADLCTSNICKLYRASIQVNQLERDNAMLLSLNYWFRDYATADKKQVFCFGENVGYPGVGLIVSKSSTDPGIPQCAPIFIDANHIDICKPTKRTADVYETFVRFLRRPELRIIPTEGSLDLTDVMYERLKGTTQLWAELEAAYNDPRKLPVVVVHALAKRREIEKLPVDKVPEKKRLMWKLMCREQEAYCSNIATDALFTSIARKVTKGADNSNTKVDGAEPAVFLERISDEDRRELQGYAQDTIAACDECMSYCRMIRNGEDPGGSASLTWLSDHENQMVEPRLGYLKCVGLAALVVLEQVTQSQYREFLNAQQELFPEYWEEFPVSANRLLSAVATADGEDGSEK